MTVTKVYDAVADFIAAMNPQKVLELKAEPEVQERLEALMDKERMEGLVVEEKDELDHYIVLERLIRLAKARALYRLAQ